MSQTDKPRVTIQEDVVFGTGGGRDLKCDVFTPPGGKPDKAPAVLLIHGGAWKLGDRKQLKGYGFLLGREGFVCVASEYRLSEEAPWPAQLHDTKAAIRWMRANADDLGIDPDRIAVSGHSSGGHMALVAAATAGDQNLEGDGGHAGVGSDVAAVVSFYAPTELTRDGEMLSEFVELLMGPDASDADYQVASPASYVHASLPPIMLMQSNLDDIVPRQQNLKLYSALVDAGATVEFHMYDGEPHAFDARPELGREAALLIKSFLNRHVPGEVDGG